MRATFPEDCLAGDARWIERYHPACVQKIDVYDTPEELMDKDLVIGVLHCLMRRPRQYSTLELIRKISPQLRTVFQLENRLAGDFFRYLIYTREKSISVKAILNEIEQFVSRSVVEMMVTEAQKEWILKCRAVASEARKEGMERGLEQGIELGLEQGKAQLVDQLLRHGIDPKRLAVMTGLSLEFLKRRLQQLS